MNKKLASAGLLVVALSLSIATGAVTPTDEVSTPNSPGTLQVSPVDGPNGDAYVSTENGRINVTLLSLNSDSTVFLDRLFEVEYRGEGSADFWIEDNNSATTFYVGRSRPINPVEGSSGLVELPGDTESSVEVGMKIDATDRSDVLTDIELIARLPEEQEEDITIDPIPGGDDGGAVEQEEAVDPTSEETVRETSEQNKNGDNRGKSVLRYDAGEVEVTVRQPEIQYDINVSDTRVLATQDVSSVATVLDTRNLETGENFNVRSEIENVGTATVTETVELTVDGDVVDTKTVEIGPDETETVEFTLAFGETGSYAIEVGDSEAVTVTAYEEGVPSYIPIGAAGILISVLAGAVAYRRRKQNEG